MITAMQEELVSKTRRKKEMHELQALGVALVELAESQIAALQIAEELRSAVLEAKRMRSHEARRRQLQYIGRLMRDVDPGPIRDQLAHPRVSRRRVLDGTARPGADPGR